jgi:hypothetical protein
MESKLTAVQWLINRWKKLQSEQEKMTWNQIIQITELAKEMEKEQIVNAHLTGLIYPLETEASKQANQYYNETFTEAKND